MKRFKKVTILLIILSVIFSISDTYAVSDTSVIYDDVTTTYITSGVTRDHITRYTTNGPVNINVLKIDLSNPNVKVDAMNNVNTDRDTVENMAKTRGAIAAVNGSFFVTLNTDPSKGYGLGVQEESGQIVSADNGISTEMGTFAISNTNQAFADYWTTNIKISSSSGYTLDAGTYNKKNDFMTCVIIDRKFSTQSFGVDLYSDIVEMVVDNGVVQEIRQSQPKTTIPQNGYIVCAKLAGDGQKLISNFKVGDKVTYDITTSPSWKNTKMAITGGSVLVQDGKIPANFSHTPEDLAGRHPRTGIGSSADGKTVYIVAVDGRQPGFSIGMTQYELAEFMSDIGASDALNLDGGGSTDIVTRPQGESDLQVLNNPSDGVQRPVPNGVGVFSIAPPGDLAGFYITPGVPMIPKGGVIPLDIKGFDTYLNPHDFDVNQIQWTIEGPPEGGEIRNGTYFIPYGKGFYTLTARAGSAVGSVVVESLGDPVSIEFENKSVNLGKNETKDLVVDGIYENGYRLPMYAPLIKFTVNGNIGTITPNGTFTASGFGLSYVMADFNGAKAYCKVKGTEEFKDEFENDNGKLSTYGQVTSGQYALSSEEKYNGGFAGRLTYSFSGSGEASLLFNNSYNIDTDITRVALWVNSVSSSNDSLDMTIQDANGISRLVPLLHELNYSGWICAEADVSGIARPAKIIKIGVSRNEATPENGVVYLDDLRLMKDGMYLARDIILPKDTPFADPDNVPASGGAPSYTFAVFGQNNAPQILLHNVLLNKLADSVNSNYDGLVMVGDGPHDSLNQLSSGKFKISTGSGYSSADIKTGRLITLNVENGSLRLNNTADQWRWFINQITSFKGTELFIFMQKSPELLTDAADKALFMQLLEEQRTKYGREVWVFFDGERDGVLQKNGVKYVTSMGYEYGDLTTFNAARTSEIVVTVKDGKATYQYVPLLK